MARSERQRSCLLGIAAQDRALGTSWLATPTPLASAVQVLDRIVEALSSQTETSPSIPAVWVIVGWRSILVARAPIPGFTFLTRQCLRAHSAPLVVRLVAVDHRAIRVPHTLGKPGLHAGVWINVGEQIAVKHTEGQRAGQYRRDRQNA